MTDKAQELIKLAEKKFRTLSKFGTLSESEKKLFKYSADGEKADYNPRSEDDNAGIKEQDILDQAEQWGDDRVLRADRIVWLCTDEEALKLLTHKGLQVAWARIEGELDLRFATPDIPITFSNCVFKETICLEQAKVKSLDLSGSHLASSLEAQFAEIEGNVFLKHFQADGTVSLYGATIGGNLDCNNGTFDFDNPKGQALDNSERRAFDDPKGYALRVERAEIKSSVYLSGRFKATGQVALYGATIGGNLYCQKGTFDNLEGYALNAYGAEIKSTVHLSDGFNAKGKVSLAGATIGGNLDCQKGTFDNPEGSVIADGAEIKGNVFLIDKFKAVGTVRFVSTIIDDILRLQEVRDSDKMILNLSFARIGTLADKEDGWPQKGNLFLDGLIYDRIDSGSPADATSRLNWLRLQLHDDDISEGTRQNEKESNYFFPQAYEKLARVLYESGYEREATKVLIGKQEDRRKYGRLSRLSKFRNWLLGFTIGHGYEPLKALGFALGFVVLGTVLFHLGYLGYSDSFSSSLITPSDSSSQPEQVSDESSSSSQPGQVSDDYPKFNPLLYSLDVFIPIMNLHQQSYWLPNANRGKEISLLLFKCKTGSLLRWYFWLHIVFGWILTSLWVAGFTGLVRRVE